MVINIFITDDHPLAIKGLENMLHPYPQFNITGTFYNSKMLLAGLKEQQPDIILLDILLPDAEGKDLAKLIIDQYRQIKIIAITSLDAPSHVKAMMRSGCSGYLLKNTDQESLVEAIETVYNGREYIEKSLREQMLDNMIRYKKKQDKSNIHTKVPHLTQREREVLLLLVDEYSNQEIADQFHLSVRTVEGYRMNLMQKFEAKTLLSLFKTAIEMGIL